METYKTSVKTLAEPQNYLRNVDLDERIILKRILKK
jgi:hypothetical protein